MSFIKKVFFLIFSHFHLMLEDPQKFLKSDFSNFLAKKVKSSFTGCWQIPKGTKSEVLVILVLVLISVWSQRPKAMALLLHMLCWIKLPLFHIYSGKWVYLPHLYKLAPKEWTSSDKIVQHVRFL